MDFSVTSPSGKKGDRLMESIDGRRKSVKFVN